MKILNIVRKLSHFYLYYDVLIIKQGVNECGLLSAINTYVYQHLLTTYCVHITTGKIFKALLTLKNNYLKIAYESEPYNNVYLSYLSLL